MYFLNLGVKGLDMPRMRPTHLKSIVTLLLIVQGRVDGEDSVLHGKFVALCSRYGVFELAIFRLAIIQKTGFLLSNEIFPV